MTTLWYAIWIPLAVLFLIAAVAVGLVRAGAWLFRFIVEGLFGEEE